MAGFKSFSHKTEIIFDKGVNLILGPNGSGKSNIADALCFVLGRLSIKSIRAAKARNLLFIGSKYSKPSREASVEIVFDNTDRAFSIDKNEINITRIVRLNGQSIYKINGEAKTRIEIIEMLAQAGIDPHGFNLILQGQIQSIVRMHPEERRKVVEEVAGISIYENRKEKSVHEMEKTEEKLKEISAILRERSSYLKNLDRERAQALRFKEIENTIKRCKASILSKKLEEKEKEIFSVDNSINDKTKQKLSFRDKNEQEQQKIDKISEKIKNINKNIQQSTGIEQETLYTNIGSLKAELEGFKVRKEHYDNRKNEIERRIIEMRRSIPQLENEIQDLKKESPLVARKSQELRKKKDEFLKIEEERNKLFSAKTEFYSFKEMLKEKEKQLSKVNLESESYLRELEKSAGNLIHRNEDECSKFLNDIRKLVSEKDNGLEVIREKIIEYERGLSFSELEINRAAQTIKKVREIDTCPLCQSKITEQHIKHVCADAEKKILDSRTQNDKSMLEISSLRERKENLLKDIKSNREKMHNLEIELFNHRSHNERSEHLKKIVERENDIKKEVIKIGEKIKLLEFKLIDLPKIQEQYDRKLLEIEEISSRTEEDVDTTLLYKERELENIRNVIKRSGKDYEEINLEFNVIQETIDKKLMLLKEREKQERDLNERFKKMFEERDSLQKELQEKTFIQTELQHQIRQVEDQINYLRIGKAKLDAEKESVEMELTEFKDYEILHGSLVHLEDRLKKAHDELQYIGAINMRALEVYNQVKQEYDVVQEKVLILEKEKNDILSIISEIDQKKKRSFMKTFKMINVLFAENFAKLYSKGTAFLELENPEDIFSGGLHIAVKLGKGKYFDVTSLSGGEQTLVALSLLFAIQEYKPYHFYIFDEIDAALDKRNSERLAALLQRYIKTGQYIVITHNDALIMNSNVLYGVSMHEGVSKILSLKVK